MPEQTTTTTTTTTTIFPPVMLSASNQTPPPCTISFSNEAELMEKLKKDCKKEMLIKEKESPTEKIFAEHGLGIFLLAVTIFSVIFIYFIRAERNRASDKSHAAGDDKKITPPTSNWGSYLQEPKGIATTLLAGTIITSGLGISMIALYKWFGFGDDFGQGSGSLVQAVWGSAATITAATVAIILALESIKQSKMTNELQKQSLIYSAMQTDHYRDAVRVVQFMDVAMIEIDAHFSKIYTIVGRYAGKIEEDNIDAFVKEVTSFYKIFDFETNLELKIALASMTFEVNSKKIRIPEFFASIKETFQEIDRSMKSNTEERSRAIVLANERGRSYWAGLRNLCNTFETTDRKELFRQVEELDIPLTQHYKPRYIRDPKTKENLDKLATLFINQRGKISNDIDEYKLFKSYLSTSGPEFLEKLKELVKNEAIPASTRNAAKRVLDENS